MRHSNRYSPLHSCLRINQFWQSFVKSSHQPMDSWLLIHNNGSFKENAYYIYPRISVKKASITRHVKLSAHRSAASYRYYALRCLMGSVRCRPVNAYLYSSYNFNHFRVQEALGKYTGLVNPTTVVRHQSTTSNYNRSSFLTQVWL